MRSSAVPDPAPPARGLDERGYHSIRETAGVVARGDLVQIRMWGRDPVRMLNGLITNDLAVAGPRRAVYAAVLTPKGKIITDLRAIVVGGQAPEIWMVLPRDGLEATRAHLGKYVPPLFARWEESDRRVIGVYGPAAGRVVAAVLGTGVEAAEDEIDRAHLGEEEITLVATRIAGGEPGFDLLVSSGRADELQRALVAAAESVGGGTAAWDALEAVRVEGGRPRFGPDFGEENLPAEVFEPIGQMDRAVSFRKGCYTGQEVVVRIAHRGHVNRAMTGLLLGASAPPEIGAPVLTNDSSKVIGRTGTAVHSPRLGQGVALAILRREVQPGEQVRIGEGGVATVAALPLVETGG